MTGTAANPPRLVVLDTSALQQNDWMRIGDGSLAEYAQVDVPPVAEDTLVPLHLPLNRTHAVRATPSSKLRARWQEARNARRRSGNGVARRRAGNHH